MKIKLLKALRKEYKIVQDEHGWYYTLKIRTSSDNGGCLMFSTAVKEMLEDYFGKKKYKILKGRQEIRLQTNREKRRFDKLNKLKTIAP